MRTHTHWNYISGACKNNKRIIQRQNNDDLDVRVSKLASGTQTNTEENSEITLECAFCNTSHHLILKYYFFSSIRLPFCCQL